jgi:hypothetical protein
VRLLLALICESARKNPRLTNQKGDNPVPSSNGADMELMLRQIILPISRRLATVVGSALTAYGVGADDVSTVTASIPVILGLVFDVAYSNVAAKRGWK